MEWMHTIVSIDLHNILQQMDMDSDTDIELIDRQSHSLTTQSQTDSVGTPLSSRLGVAVQYNYIFIINIIDY